MHLVSFPKNTFIRYYIFYEEKNDIKNEGLKIICS